MFVRAWRLYKFKNIRQQPAVNKAIEESIHDGLKVKLLDIFLFPPGWVYFEMFHHLYSPRDPGM